MKVLGWYSDHVNPSMLLFIERQGKRRGYVISKEDVINLFNRQTFVIKKNGRVPEIELMDGGVV